MNRSIAFKFGTDFHHVIGDTLRMSKVTGSKVKIKNQEWFIKYCSTDAGLQRYSGNVFTTNTITNSVMTAQWR